MWVTWGLEILKGLGLFFLHPVGYGVLILAIMMGIKRVKRERHDFSVRVYAPFQDVLASIFPSIVIGLIVSLITIGLGFVIPVGMILLLALTSLVFLLIGNVRLLSPAYVMSTAIVIALLFPEISTGASMVNTLIQDLHTVNFSTVCLLLAVAILIEGFLISYKGAHHTSPFISKSKRGKMIGLHESQRIWLLPLFVLFPGGSLAVHSYWPVIPFADTGSFALWLIPLAIGFQLRVRSTLPKEIVAKIGKQVLALGTLVLVLAIGAIWLPILSTVIVVIAIGGRELIHIVAREREEKQPAYFANRDLGMVVLDVLKNSPADKMSLRIGEIITKANGTTVKSETEFYQALQSNRAHCKLEVFDLNGEIRFVQRALYDGEHHELGLLFVPDQKEWPALIEVAPTTET